MILQNIWRRVVGSHLINISSSNIFQTLLMLERFLENCQYAFNRFIRYVPYSTD